VIVNRGIAMEITLKEIADSIGGKVIGDDQILITGMNSLKEASHKEISFFSDSRYRESLKKTRASALLVSEMTDLFHGPQVVVSDPSLAYARVAGLFAPSVPRFSGISDGTTIHESSRIGEDVSIPMFMLERALILVMVSLCFQEPLSATG
jgi:UDP-3-O-[3-hydroxymyristoyl] glucosamine N-acyltransferase